MSTDTIKEKIEKNKPEIAEKFFVKEIGLFGSYVRNEQTPKSDLDVLVDFYKPIGWDVVDLQDYLQKLLGVKVDLVLKKGLIRNKKLWKLVKQEVLYV
ncbi:MAG: nucleotidyltransferase [Stygiobacter sp. RIFOXYC12_FULL_38_8]|nr:MAG: nucleotidyltransferase [Stygiobacter sp. GWC2_38_9]OGU84773.1 MAG: nucleotidyltransferase [Stygiobacter sp. RIFOXYA12_FULL_38_9]OGV07709.1 MAG: nucleotidyltransferase [Stygiobacter sp. RIFOXYB2_FULL_37_11]OGV12712.1 MAG: nucleotidyltransferase [Stygiobacter sp. RIFOXYC2_FULL_38_25]OGV17635.1 MAG: nucleotidyltransferase [Stygiobacter sp. RIFOXYA2_FULL_38_8]OGV26970.1 MAG: nucleotidyltransferase [Stygiobacter sp. RIFOXYC12_FULL_38_8]OGV82031.1 MAG: nucleotidyltransferase [Stygiobacter s